MISYGMETTLVSSRTTTLSERIEVAGNGERERRRRKGNMPTRAENSPN
jgi:hypothetical protein